jgi:Ca-activated chloride channel family protein
MKKPLAASLIVLVAACTTEPTHRPVDDASQSPGAATSEGTDAPPRPAPATPAGSRIDALTHARVQADAARRIESAREARPFAPPAAGALALPHPFPRPGPVVERERYQSFESSPVRLVAEAPVSTFSIDVDTGSYSNVRRMLVAGRLPPKDAVRVEEMVNYFPYGYPGPTDGHPFAVHAELVDNPWRPGSKLLRIGIKGEDRARESLPPANLVFLVDVSGSMDSPDKLPLLKSSLRLLAQRLRPQDRISLVTYASGTRLVLPATAGSETAKIVEAIDSLVAGGSTAGASGIELAYRSAAQAFIPGGINRILLATDGDFNVGVTDFGQLKSMVEERRRSGIALSTLGFGTGNYNEHLMEQLADAGDGAYAYIDNLMEAQKVLVDQASSTLETIARDVKVQVEFNPALVTEYRLVGYENRALAREDFGNDRVDAGEIGAGHTVTALYELTLAGAPGYIDPPRYGQRGSVPTAQAGATADEGPAYAHEFAFVRLRYKRPGEGASVLFTRAVTKGDVKRLDEADADSRFAIAVAGFGELLRGGRHAGDWDWRAVRELASRARGEDAFGYRGEFLRLVDLAASLATPGPRDGQGG